MTAQSSEHEVVTHMSTSKKAPSKLTLLYYKFLEKLSVIKDQNIRVVQEEDRVYFFCSLCSTWCYSEASLHDHINGKKHQKKMTAVPSPFPEEPDTPSSEDEPASTFSPPWRIPKSGKAVNGGKKAQDLELETSTKHGIGLLASLPSLGAALVTFPCKESTGRDGLCNLSLTLTKLGTSRSSQLHGSMKNERLQVALVLPWTTDTLKLKDVQISSLDKKRKAASLVPPAVPFKSRKKNQTRSCFICKEVMKFGSEVATLFNTDTHLIACHSRNHYGKFHIFHTECLSQWIILCAVKMLEGPFSSAPGQARFILPTQSKHITELLPYHSGSSESGSEDDSSVKEPTNGLTVPQSIFCPECQGTGKLGNDESLEKPLYKLSQVHHWILEVALARRTYLEQKLVAEQKDPLSEKRGCGLLFPNEELQQAAEFFHHKLEVFPSGA